MFGSGTEVERKEREIEAVVPWVIAGALKLDIGGWRSYGVFGHESQEGRRAEDRVTSRAQGDIDTATPQFP